jgi:hypothetical protein
MVTVENYRFDEKTAWFQHVLNNSQHLTVQQINNMLDSMNYEWDDLTFKFYSGGGDSVKIIDNSTDEEVHPSDLNQLAKDYYISKILERFKNKMSNVKQPA